MGRILNGRQILWLVHDQHKLDAEHGALYDFTGLLPVKRKRNSSLEPC